MNAAVDQLSTLQKLIKDGSCGQKDCLVNQAEMQQTLATINNASSIHLAIMALVAVLGRAGATYNGQTITESNIGAMLFTYMKDNEQAGNANKVTFIDAQIPLTNIVHMQNPLTIREMGPFYSSLYWLFAPQNNSNNAPSLLSAFGSQSVQKDPFSSATSFQKVLDDAYNIDIASQGLNALLKDNLNDMSTSNPTGFRDLLSYYQDLQTNAATPTLALMRRFINANSNNGSKMYGADIEFGFKHFFGQRRRFGLRYYEYFSYKHGNNELNGAINDIAYGAGMDALYNFFENRQSTFTMGIFAGLILAGDTWLVDGSSAYQELADKIETAGGRAHVKPTAFQLPLNVGFRTNIGSEGFEVGARFPMLESTYFKGSLDTASESLRYRVRMSVFANWVHNF